MKTATSLAASAGDKPMTARRYCIPWCISISSTARACSICRSGRSGKTYSPENGTPPLAEGKRERELVYVFQTVYDGEVLPAPDELAGGRFFSPDEILQKIGKDYFTPNFEDEYMKFFGNR